MKVREVFFSDGRHHGWAIDCPGCHEMHVFDDRWRFDLDEEKPTFYSADTSRPFYMRSMLVRGRDAAGKPTVCHSEITNGMIRFTDDTTHPLANQTVDLPRDCGKV